MRNELMEVFGESPNAWVVRIPGRRFPGVVVQGDSLANLRGLVLELRQLMANGNYGEAKDVTVEMDEMVSGLLAAYEEAVKNNGLELPYSSSVP